MKIYDYLLLVLFLITATLWWALMGFICALLFVVGKLNPKTVRKIQPYIHGNEIRDNFCFPAKGLEDYIEPGSKILDVGSGSGIKARDFAKHYKSRVTLCDIDDFNKTNLPLKIIDGLNLPYKDNSFDVVLVSFVLHHAVDFEKLIKEAKRVSSKLVVVFEDDKRGVVAELFTVIHGKWFNWMYEINNQCQFFSKEEWEKIFKKYKFKIDASFSKWRFDSLSYPLKECVFVLNKN